MDLEHLEGLDDEVAERLALLLAVVDAVAEVLVLRLEEVEDGQDLPVVCPRMGAMRATSGAHAKFDQEAAAATHDSACGS